MKALARWFDLIIIAAVVAAAITFMMAEDAIQKSARPAETMFDSFFSGREQKQMKATKIDVAIIQSIGAVVCGTCGAAASVGDMFFRCSDSVFDSLGRVSDCAVFLCSSEGCQKIHARDHRLINERRRRENKGD